MARAGRPLTWISLVVVDDVTAEECTLYGVAGERVKNSKKKDCDA